jgi:hypothetical protein
MEMFQSDIYMWAAHRTREMCGSDACGLHIGLGRCAVVMHVGCT